MKKFIPALVNGAKGRKLVLLRGVEDFWEIEARYPLAEIEYIDYLDELPATDVYRALDSYLKGLDGLLYCHKEFEGRHA